MTTRTPPLRPLPVYLGHMAFLLESARARGMTLEEHLGTPLDPRPQHYRPLTPRAALRRMRGEAQRAHAHRCTRWRLGVPPVELADLEPASVLSITSAEEVERVELTPHRPLDTGALPPVALPRVPEPKDTHNRVCSASTREDLPRRCTTR